MTNIERLNDLKKRLHTLEVKNAISGNRYSAEKTLLKQAEEFIGIKNPPELQLDLLAIQLLDSAENLIKGAEDKGS